MVFILLSETFFKLERLRKTVEQSEEPFKQQCRECLDKWLLPISAEQGEWIVVFERCTLEQNWDVGNPAANFDTTQMSPSQQSGQIQAVVQLHCMNKLAIDTTIFEEGKPDTLTQMIRSAAFTE